MSVERISEGSTYHMLNHTDEWPGVRAWLMDEGNGIEWFSLLKQQGISEPVALRYVEELASYEEYFDRAKRMRELGIEY